MSSLDPNAICASVELAVPAGAAFEFMADGMKQDHWALGSMGREALGDGLFVGRNSFDGSELYVKLESYPDLLLVDYSTGPSPEQLVPHVEARIRPGSWLGRDDSVCVVTLTIWRDGDSDEDWEFHFHLWRTEVRLIKGAIERGL